MKHPFKIVGLLIVIAAITISVWPGHNVRDHDPVTGEGALVGEDNHAHLDPVLPLPPEKTEEILTDEAVE